MTRSKKMLRLLIEADKVLETELGAATRNAQVYAAVKKYNAVCIQAAEAFYEDTKDRNNRDTIMSVLCGGADGKANKDFFFHPKTFKRMVEGGKDRSRAGNKA